MNKIILATNNPHKKDKLSWIVDGYFSPMEMPEKIDVDENGDTFEDNAKIKAREIAKKFGEYAIASDGGALIPALATNGTRY
jgi:XTP/dITP diphosphohydrolase